MDSKPSKVARSPARRTPACPGPTPLLNKKARFTLLLKTTKTAKPGALLLNRFEEPDSTLVEVSATPVNKYDPARNEEVPFTEEELDAPAFVGDTLVFKETIFEHTPADPRQAEKPVAKTERTFHSDTGSFSVREMVANICAFEQEARPKTLWFGGLDAHHVWFEGVRLNPDGTCRILWGS